MKLPNYIHTIAQRRLSVVEASAGTGKTYAIEHLVLERILSGVPLERILVVTFTEKATREMRHRIRARLAQASLEALDDPSDHAKTLLRWVQLALSQFDTASISTIHAFCERLLKEHALLLHAPLLERVERERAFSIAFREEIRGALRKADPVFASLSELVTASPQQALLQLEGHLLRWLPERDRMMVKLSDEEVLLSQCSRVDLARHASPAFATLLHQFLPRIYQRMQQRKSEHAQYDFDDLLEQTSAALAKNDAPLLAAIRQRYRLAIVDEFQDTDSVQWDIFRRAFVESDEGHQLVLVGDPKQAIYSFRGADVETYLRAKQHVAERSGGITRLSTNYRASQALVKATNILFRRRFFLKDIAYEAVTSGRGAAEEGTNKEAPIVRMRLRGFLRAQAVRDALGAHIAQEAKRLISAPPSDLPSSFAYRDIYVLTRTTSEARMITAQLQRGGVPAALYREEGLFQSIEAQDVLEVLRAILHPDDEARREFAFLTPFFATGLSDRGSTSAEVVRRADTHLLHHWHQLMLAERWSELFLHISDRSGLKAFHAGQKDGERHLSDTLQLLDLMHERLIAEAGRLSRVVRELELYIKGRQPPFAGGNVRRASETRDAVQVLTMHKAKGLEASVVFIAGGFSRVMRGEFEPRVCHQDGVRQAWLSPLPRPAQEAYLQGELEEQERLIYVALTRARDRMYLPYFGPVSREEDLDRRDNYRGLKGPYQLVNHRLRDLLCADELAPEEVNLFRDVEVDVPKPNSDAAVQDRTTAKAPLETKRPSKAKGKPELADPPGLDPMLEELKAERQDFTITSYSQLKANAGGRQDNAFSTIEERASSEPAEGRLPGGTTAGVFLHSVLERLDYASALGCANAATWAALPEVRLTVTHQAARFGVPETQLNSVFTMLYQVLSLPLTVPTTWKLAALNDVVREMGFCFPIPAGKRAERGFIRGALDLVFRLDGKYYVLDWKSDTLPSYRGDAVATHVTQNYELQLKLYSLALQRHLGIVRRSNFDSVFGGIFYVFLRGVPDCSEEAFFYQRPSWAELEQWNSELEKKTRPWGYPLSNPFAP